MIYYLVSTSSLTAQNTRLIPMQSRHHYSTRTLLETPRMSHIFVYLHIYKMKEIVYFY